jgi:hypothetical protein
MSTSTCTIVETVTLGTPTTREVVIPFPSGGLSVVHVGTGPDLRGVLITFEVGHRCTVSQAVDHAGSACRLGPAPSQGRILKVSSESLQKPTRMRKRPSGGGYPTRESKFNRRVITPFGVAPATLQCE